jgi:hypothetical protein
MKKSRCTVSQMKKENTFLQAGEIKIAETREFRRGHRYCWDLLFRSETFMNAVFFAVLYIYSVWHERNC